MSSQPVAKVIDLEDVNDLNDEESSLIVEQRMTMTRMSGPLPHPQTLREYEEILPGAAERIITMAEKQSDHRQQMESKVVSGGLRDSLLGVIFAFVIGMTTVIVGFLLGREGKNIPAAIIGTGGIVGLVSVFVYGTRSNRIERIHEEKSVQQSQDDD